MIFCFLISVLVAALLIMLEVCFSFIFLLITCDLVIVHNCQEKRKVINTALQNNLHLNVWFGRNKIIHFHAAYVIWHHSAWWKLFEGGTCYIHLQDRNWRSSINRIVINFYQAICHIPEASNLQSHCNEALKSHLFMWIKYEAKQNCFIMCPKCKS